MDASERINRLLERVVAIADELRVISAQCDREVGADRPAELKQARLLDLRDQARAYRKRYHELMELVEAEARALGDPPAELVLMLEDWRQKRAGVSDE